MKKLILSVLAGLGSAMPFYAADGDTFTYDGLIYNVLSEADKTCEVGVHTYKDPELAKGAVVIPAKVLNNGVEYTVTAIGQNAFIYNMSMTSVSIPETVTRIKASAFEKVMYVNEIVIPNSVTEIDTRAFLGLWALEKLTISSNVREIKRETFTGNAYLKEIVIPDGIEIVGAEAFNQCGNSADEIRVTISSTVTSIGKMAFSGCEKLTEVSIPASVKTVGDQAFSYCPMIKTVTLEESDQTLNFGVDVFGESKYAHLADGGIAKIETVNMNRPISGNSAVPDDMPFAKKETLKTVNIGKLVSVIPANCFANSNNITTINVARESFPSASASSFPEVVYNNATLTVPFGTTDDYKSNPVWGSFLKTEESSESGISSIVVDADASKVVEYYDLSGRPVKGQVAPGVYVVRRADGSTGKVIVKTPVQAL